MDKAVVSSSSSSSSSLSSQQPVTKMELDNVLSPIAIENTTDNMENKEEIISVVIRPTLIPFAEPPLGTVDDFVERNPLYPACIVTLYQIVRDLYIKQDLIELTIINASKWQRNEYFIQGRTRMSGNLRLLVPFYLDAEIDLPW